MTLQSVDGSKFYEINKINLKLRFIYDIIINVKFIMQNGISQIINLVHFCLYHIHVRCASQ